MLYPNLWAVRSMAMVILKKKLSIIPVLHPPSIIHTSIPCRHYPRLQPCQPCPHPRAPVAPAPRVATWWLRRSAAHPAATLPSSLGGDSWTHPPGLKASRKHSSATYSIHVEYADVYAHTMYSMLVCYMYIYI